MLVSSILKLPFVNGKMNNLRLVCCEKHLLHAFLLVCVFLYMCEIKCPMFILDLSMYCHMSIDPFTTQSRDKQILRKNPLKTLW